MSIRNKTLLAMGASLFVVLAVLFLVTHQLMMSRFSALERRRAVEDVLRVRLALSNSVQDLGLKVLDWSAWDDAYSFVRTRDPQFVRSNLVDSVFADQRFNLVAFFDDKGKVVYAKGYDYEGRRRIPVDGEMLKRVTGGGALLKHRDVADRVEGILVLKRGPMIVASQPIITSDKTGPIRGTMIVGRFLSNAEIQRISNVTRFRASIYNMGAGPPREMRKAAGSKADVNGVETRPIDRNWIAGYMETRDIFGKKALLLRVVMPRDITKQSRRGAKTFYAVFVMLSAGSLALILFLLEGVVLAPLGRMARNVMDIGKKGDLAARLDARGRDELAAVGTAVNSMLDDLEVSHRALAIQEALRESEERYRNLVEYSPDAVFILSAGRVVFVNDAALGLIRETRSERVTGKTLTEFVSPEDPELFERWVKSGGTAPPRMEMKFTRNDGSAVYADLAGSAYHYGGDATIQIVAHDDTKRIRSERQLSQVNEIFLSFGPNPNENIERLTTLCGEMMEPSFAFYCRLEDGTLQTIGRWNAPVELPPILAAAGSAVYECVRGGSNEALVLDRLPGAGGALDGDALAESCGINALIVKAVRFQDDYIGSLCLAYRTPTPVAEEDKKFLTIIAGAVGVEEKRRLAETAIQRRLESEKSISAISSRFVSAEDMDYALSSTLEDLGDLSGAKRVALFVFDEKARSMRNTEEWYAEGEESRSGSLQNVPLSMIRHFRDRMSAGDSVDIKSVSAEPVELISEIRLVGGNDISSILALPLQIEHRLAGFIAFMGVGEKKRLSDEDVALMRVTTEIIGSAISRKGAESRLKYLAYYDEMMDLPNRALFDKMLEIGINRSRVSGDGFAVMLIDINRFKEVNDTVGHAEGDRILKSVAKRLKGSLRSCDFLARHSGDEFIAMIENVVAEEQAEEVARNTGAAFEEPFVVESNSFYLSATIGVCLFPSGGETVEDLVMNADMAMYRAKEPDSPRNFELFTAQLRTALTERKTLERELHDAVENDELVLNYQPQVEIATGRVVGAEALIRWEHPRLGLLSPVKFIPIAEDSGLIVPIGEWVLRTAARRNRAWQEAGLPPIRMAANLSARQFLNQDLLAIVKSILDETGLDPKWFELEVTESVAMVNIDATLAILADFHRLGVQLSIDDFGTGYSSLSYLRSFPVDTVKIAGAFLRDVLHNADSAAIVQAIITLTHTMHRRVIAEEVETRDQLDFLLGIGCDEVQGYYFSRPLVAEKFEAILRSGGVIRP